MNEEPIPQRICIILSKPLQCQLSVLVLGEGLTFSTFLIIIEKMKGEVEDDQRRSR
jgi:hypothetical protein